MPGSPAASCSGAWPIAGEDPAALNAILITHEHHDHVAGLAVLARRLNIPVFFTEPTHRAWVRMLTPRTTMTYAKWLDHLQQEKEARAATAATSTPHAARSHRRRLRPKPPRSTPHSTAGHRRPSLRSTRRDLRARSLRPRQTPDPTFLPAVEYFHAGTNFSIGDIDITPFTIPHDAADPCGFVFESPPKASAWPSPPTSATCRPTSSPPSAASTSSCSSPTTTSRCSSDGPYPWSVKQRVLSRVGHLSNDATAEFLQQGLRRRRRLHRPRPPLRVQQRPRTRPLSAEQAIGDRMTLLGNRILLAQQAIPLDPICL